jgi:hypothetical protein
VSRGGGGGRRGGGGGEEEQEQEREETREEKREEEEGGEVMNYNPRSKISQKRQCIFFIFEYTGDKSYVLCELNEHMLHC